MRKTNLESSYRLKIQESCCSFRGLLYSKATLFFALLLLPALIFAQSNKQQQLTEKEARNQAFLDAKYGNKTVADQPMVFQNAVSTASNLEVAADDNEYYMLLKTNQINEQAFIAKGMSKEDIKSHILNEIEISKDNNVATSIVNSSRVAVSGADTPCDSSIETIYCTTDELNGIQGTNSGYNTDSEASCGGPANTTGSSWYKIVGNGTTTQIEVVSSNAHFLQLYEGSCDALTCVTQNNIGQGSDFLAFNTVLGQEYYLKVDSPPSVFGSPGGQGPFTIFIVDDGCSGPSGTGATPADAFTINCSDTASGQNNVATQSGPTCDFDSTSSNGAWYVVTAQANEAMAANLCGSDYDVEVHVYDSALNCLGRDDFGDDCVTSNTTFPAYVSWNATAGEDYYIYVGAFSSTTIGNYELLVECGGDVISPPPSFPDNDLCPDAITINCSDTGISGSTILATRDDEVAFNCGGFSGDTPTGPGVWYKVEGDNNQYTINTCTGSNYDTKLFVYEGACGALTCVTGNDDSCGVQSQVIFNANDGTDYYIYVTGFSTSVGDFELTISCDPLAVVPDNDNCADAESIACGGTDSGSTVLAAPELGLSFCGTDVNDSPGVWYTIQGTGEIFTIDTNGSDFDTVLAVFTGSCGTFTCVDGDDSSGDGDASRVQFRSSSGTTYYIYLSGDNTTFGGALSGNYVINVFCEPNPCIEATPIECGDALAGSNSGANGSTAGPSETCGTSPGVRGNYYVFEGNDKFVNINTCDADFDTKLNVYTGTCDALICLTGNDDTPSDYCDVDVNQSRVDFFAEAGTTYYIWVSGFGSSVGDYTLSLTCQEVVENDLCTDAPALACGSTTSGTTLLSTDRGVPEEGCANEAPNQGVWYTVAGTGGDIVASTCTFADFDTILFVYTGSCNDLVCVDANDDADCGAQSEVQFSTNQGETYYIYVTGFGEQEGAFDLTIDCLCAPAIEATQCVTLFEGYDPASTAVLMAEMQFATGNVSYDWSNGAPDQQSITVGTAGGDRNITVTMEDEVGCTSTQTFFIAVIDVDCDRGNSNKVEICHGGNTICVNENAVAAHLAHGDSLGACGTQLCDEILPFCDTEITAPADGEADVSIFPTISWTAATGVVDSYNVVISAGGMEVVNVNVNGLSYNVVDELAYETEHTVTVTPVNGVGAGNCDISVSFTTIEDPLPNDDCEGAIMLTVNADLDCGVVYAGNNIDATPSPQPDDVSGTPNTDVWFSFVATSSAHRVSLDNVVNVGGGTSTSTDMGMGVYNASTGCDNLIFVDTSDPNTLNLGGLTIGDTYVVRVYGWFTSIQNTTFDICVGTPPPPVVNDTLDGAIPIAISEGCNPFLLEFDSNETETTSDSGLQGSCSTSGLDQFFSWTATSLELVWGSDSPGDPGIVIWDATGTIEYDCFSTFSSGVLSGWELGDELIIQIYDFDGSQSDVAFCLGTPSSAPANDDCANAESLTVNADTECGVVTPGTIASATDSGVDTCNGTEDDDVWYTFVATSTAHTVSLINLTGGTTDLYHAVYEADNCGALGSAITCSDPNNSTTSGLTIGQTYYVQVYSWTSTSGQTTSFDICVGTPAGPPANDECANAESLTVNADLECGVVTSGTTTSATASSVPDDITGTPNNDVWYSFVATSSTHKVELLNTVNADGGFSTDMGMAVYENDGCTNPTLIDDSDPNTLTVGGLTPGNTYLVRVYGWSSTIVNIDFDICLGTPPPPPANEVCSGAIAIECGVTVNATTNGTTGSDDEDGGCFVSDYGVWFTFVGDGSVATITTVAAPGYDQELSVSSGICGGLDPIDCEDSSGSGGTETISVATVAGVDYYAYVGHWSSSSSTTGDFTINVSSCQGARQANPELEWTLYPNPSKGQVNLDLKDFVNNDIHVQVLDLRGNVILNRTVQDLQDPKLQIELNNVPTGMYMVRVQSNDNVSTKRLIIKN